MDPEHASKQLGLNDTLRLFVIDSYLQVFEHGLKRFWKSRLRQVGSTHFTTKKMLTALLPSPIECFRCSFQLWCFFVPGHFLKCCLSNIMIFWTTFWQIQGITFLLIYLTPTTSNQPQSQVTFLPLCTSCGTSGWTTAELFLRFPAIDLIHVAAISLASVMDPMKEKAEWKITTLLFSLRREGKHGLCTLTYFQRFNRPLPSELLFPPLSTHHMSWCPNISSQPSAVAMETKGPCFVMSQSAWDFTGSELRKRDTELRQKRNHIKRTSPNQEQPELVTSCMMSCFHPIFANQKPIFDAFEAVKVTYSFFVWSCSGLFKTMVWKRYVVKKCLTCGKFGYPSWISRTESVAVIVWYSSYDINLYNVSIFTIIITIIIVVVGAADTSRLWRVGQQLGTEDLWRWSERISPQLTERKKPCINL